MGTDNSIINIKYHNRGYLMIPGRIKELWVFLNQYGYMEEKPHRKNLHSENPLCRTHGPVQEPSLMGIAYTDETGVQVKIVA